ncbi:TolC family protein [bacterium]|nr:TolC family protein [bacterium]NBW98670.1 TolC family protein [bacterium]NBX82517.1 TolC family protein [bacterium]
MNAFYAFLAGLLLGVPAQAIPSAISLQSAYSEAVKKTEVVPQQEEAIKQAEEKYRQAFGSILPTISGLASYQWQAAAGGGAFSPNRQPLVRVSAQQPLFRGLREFAALKQTRFLQEAAQQQKEFALRQLFNDVTQHFYLVLSLEQEILNIQSQITALEKRISDLKQRIKIGRSRLTESLTVQASLSTLKAQLVQTEGQLKVARETFSFTTGLPDSSKLQDGLSIKLKVAPVETYLETLNKRPELKMRQLQYEAADQGVSIAKGAHLPNIDLNGNYYFKRFGFFDQIPWDFGISLTLPILNGGILSSRVSEANSLRMQAELEVLKAKRAAIQEIQSLHATVQADLEQLSALTEARNLNEANFKQQNREYRNGLVNNLEVLQALTAFEESKRNLDRAQYQTKIDYLKLETATGNLPQP